MISPPVTASPAKPLTPRRWAFESRPLRLDPRPFLCAIAVPLVSGRLLGRRLLRGRLLRRGLGLSRRSLAVGLLRRRLLGGRLLRRRRLSRRLRGGLLGGSLGRLGLR